MNKELLIDLQDNMENLIMAKEKLERAFSMLNNSVKINDVGIAKLNNNILTKLQQQINNINEKVIPKIEEDI